MASSFADFVQDAFKELSGQVPAYVWILASLLFLFTAAASVYTLIFIAAPIPRAPIASETTFTTIEKDGKQSRPQKLPCWHDAYLAQKLGISSSPNSEAAVEKAEVFMSLVVPAYNEELRLGAMLEEATAFLEREYGKANVGMIPSVTKKRRNNGSVDARGTFQRSPHNGWEILVVSDGSTDKTNAVVLKFAERYPGGSIRLVELVRNRGKGGAVVHGMRHVRGEYIVFADADGASKFEDLGKLVRRCREVQDSQGRAVAVGSRAHLVGSEAVVKRSKLRNFLMHSFHLLLRFLTPPATSRIKDTQCGFKLFSRAALPWIVPNMHSEGWIFDVEMLMLAESANIPMVEVPIGWKEVGGSKLNVVWDSLGMAWGLAILRAAWAVGVYQT